jgi:hypothetical protein
MQMPAELTSLNGAGSLSDASKTVEGGKVSPTPYDPPASRRAALWRALVDFPRQLLFNYANDVIKTAKQKQRLDVPDIPVHVDIDTASLYNRFDRARGPKKSTDIKSLARAMTAGTLGSFIVTAVAHVISQGSTLEI